MGPVGTINDLPLSGSFPGSILTVDYDGYIKWSPNDFGVKAILDINLEETKGFALRVRFRKHEI